MQTPNIFLHYYNSDEAAVSFLEIMQSDVAPEILTVIQEELVHQLSGAVLAEKLPNFDWQNARMQEKWQSAVNLLLPHVILPDMIWQSWIASLSQDNSAPADEIPSFSDLLTADVYYASPSDSLPDLIEVAEEPIPEEIIEEEIVVETPIIEEEIVEEIPAAIEAEIVEEIPAVAEAIPDYFEVSDELPEIQPIEEIQEEEPTEIEKPKSINELHAASSEEKVLDTIQVTDHSLKNMVEINMTNSLGESISLFQKLNFIQDLFEGNADEFQRLIEFVDTQASATKWKSEIEGKFGQYLNAENEDTWNEFYILVDRKFN
ncbi:hypothetical protein U0R10_10535 [Aquirufa sp. OSTEICH-129V]|uniref:Uncharacterized protein n=1 Tax=Aquirufa avitistagni TaxID=3104728 RepID=A0ABW6DE95_9BACT